jgi:hypothetical protein
MIAAQKTSKLSRDERPQRISAPSLAMLARSFRLSVLMIVTASVVAFGVVGGLIAVGLGF